MVFRLKKQRSQVCVIPSNVNENSGNNQYCVCLPNRITDGHPISIYRYILIPIGISTTSTGE